MAEHKIKITTNKMRVISFEDKNVIQKITKDEATNIIETYKPIGKFYLVDGDLFIGIDNSTGCAWTEEFDNIDDCMEWLSQG